MIDNWTSLALKDLFKGLQLNVDASLEDVTGKIDEAQNLLNALTDKIDTFNTLLEDVQKLGDALGASGFYVLPLLPGEGNPISRINAANSGPPSLGATYSVGVVIIGQAPSLSQVVSMYNKLKVIISI